MRLAPNEVVLQSANPNRHGWMYLTQWKCEDGESVYIVYDDPEDTAYGHEYGTLQKATTHFDDEVRRLSILPNWDAQAEYDAIHGDPLDRYPSPSEY